MTVAAQWDRFPLLDKLFASQLLFLSFWVIWSLARVTVVKASPGVQHQCDMEDRKLKLALAMYKCPHYQSRTVEHDLQVPILLRRYCPTLLRELLPLL